MAKAAMTIEEFEASLEQRSPPPVDAELRALWHDRQGDWDRAHRAVQDQDSRASAWVHAYLHRKEGDESNASYWYARARKPFPADVTLDEEWRTIATELLYR